MKQRTAGVVLLAALAAACSSVGESGKPVHPVEGVRKVVDSLGAEIAKRAATDAFRGLPIVIRTTTVANTGIEPIIAELLRTRLVERGLPVDAACAPRCLEVALQEMAVETPKGSMLSAGQVLTVAGGAVPVVGGLIRTIGEQEREKERAATRASGLFVTLAARDGNRYQAREHVIAIISAGDVALQ